MRTFQREMLLLEKGGIHLALLFLLCNPFSGCKGACIKMTPQCSHSTLVTCLLQKLTHARTHLFKKYLLSISYSPGNVDSSRNKTDKASAL